MKTIIEWLLRLILIILSPVIIFVWALVIICIVAFSGGNEDESFDKNEGNDCVYYN